MGEAVPLDAFLRRRFPFGRFKPLGRRGQLDVLIAGCGTGQHSTETAQLFSGARMLALDLSLASLAYAKRKTRELGLTNIEYAQADINRLSSLGRSFDLIESVGVLHHLADPMLGWRALLSLLRPGGFMRLGFYSETARRHIVAARRLIAERGYAATLDDMRLCRQELMPLGGLSVAGAVAQSSDFYAASGCRDMLFHVQEHRYSLAQLGACLKELGLDFVGFLHQPPVLAAYSERFPGDRSMSSLEFWSLFEMDNPATFTGMYQFWVQKRDSL